MKRVEENLGSIGNSKVLFVEFILGLFFILFHCEGFPEKSNLSGSYNYVQQHLNHTMCLLDNYYQVC